MKTISIVWLSLLLTVSALAQNPVSVRTTNGVAVGISLSGVTTNNGTERITNADNTAQTPLDIEGSTNGFYQLFFRNTSSGAGGSTDLIIGNDRSNPNSTSNFLDLGQNSSGFTPGVGLAGGPNDSYLWAATNSTNLLLGTQQSNGAVQVWIGGNNPLTIGSNSVAATLSSSSTFPIIVPNLRGTVFGTNGNGYMKGSGSTFTGVHIGDQFIISNTLSQFWITSVTNGNDTVGIYPPSSTITVGSNITMNIQPLGFRDTTGAYYGGVGADASISIQSDANALGNSGHIVLTSQDGAHSMWIQNESSDALGIGLTIGSTLIGNGGGSTIGALKVYAAARFESLTVCPNSTYGGSVGVRALTNTQGVVIPALLTIAAVGQTNGFATYNTNQYPVAATGWTNTNAFNCVAYANGTAVAVTFSDGTNTIATSTISTITAYAMHPSYKITAAAGLSGVVIAQ